MSFNEKSAGTRTHNLAGGIAYKESPELELVSLLLTSFGQDKFYESASESFERLKNLLHQVDPEFAAKAAIYARREFGMRSITHVLASELARIISGKPFARRFYNQVIDRLDDMTEIMAYHISRIDVAGAEISTQKMHQLSSAMKTGFRQAFSRFDSYQLAKYKSAKKSVKLIDMVNLLHPSPSEKNGNAFELLLKGQLKSTKTSTAEMTAIGQRADITEEQRNQLKAESWLTRIVERQIGYFDLLKNLRNIIQQAPEAVDEACKMLTQPNLIHKSRILPFRYLTAYEEIQKHSEEKARAVLVALTQAVDISAENVPRFDGKTCVILDCSGSMQGKSHQIGSLFAASLIKANHCDLVFFGSQATHVQYNPMDSVTSLARAMPCSFGGTDFGSAFKILQHPYDRIIILSDMQGWQNDYALKPSFAEYKRRFNIDPQLWSFDLAGHGTLQFPERNIYCIAGFSEKIFELMKKLCEDRHAMINEINSIQL